MRGAHARCADAATLSSGDLTYAAPASTMICGGYALCANNMLMAISAARDMPAAMMRVILIRLREQPAVVT